MHDDFGQREAVHRAQEPVRKPEVLDPVIIDIFERGIKTETPVSPEIVEEIKDASIFRPQPQPTSAKVDEEVIKQLPPADGPQQKPRLPIRFLDEERRKVPNTGGRYPATVVHRADVIVTTDLDTGEHTAALVELKGEPQVGARQPKPAAAKKIRGRTLDVEVQTGGQVKTTPVKRKGRHTVTPQEVESFPPWSKAKKKPKTPKPVFPNVGKRRNSARRRPPPGFKPPRLPGRRR